MSGIGLWQRALEQPCAVFEIDRHLFQALPCLGFHLDAMAPGGDRIRPTLDPKCPRALRLAGDRALVPVGAGADESEPLKRALAPLAGR